MECLKSDFILKFRPDTLYNVRKDVNLEQSGRINEALDILEDWVQKQSHFVKRDFSRDYLERILVTAKGLVERAKERLDKLCTFKTLMPEFFTVPDVKKEFEPLFKVIVCAHLPQMTPEYHRVFFIKMVSDHLDSSLMFSFYKYITAVSEYAMQAEYCSGFQIVLDCMDINVMNLVTKVNPIDLRQIMTLMTEGYGTRIKGIHVITASKMVDTLVSLLKQVFSTKLGDRIHLHKSAESWTKTVPKEILPREYGGDQKPLIELNKDWHEAISSKTFLDYMSEMGKAKTNESCRTANNFNENYVGMPGSFRALSVD
ncbi:unnamed protein product [Chrysodeixis includens]|uniref:CRAL-TRIO domain-containing protein n=1 Tax=Chrysodeixis includens TaxID=689277 RepID=A0A9P0BW32_CHRIL|nr:unnamed protein product [Chrysodeixis includens]